MPITKEVLDKCFAKMKLSESTWERLQRYRARAESITPPYATVGGRGSELSDKVGNGVAAMDELVRQSREQVSEYAELAVIVNEAIFLLLDDPLQQNIMGLRYLDGMEWSMIAEKLNYSERRCYQIHRAALIAMGIDPGEDCSPLQPEV